MARKTGTNAYDAIRAAVREGDCSFAYVFSGEEDYLKDAALKELRSLISPGMDEFNLYVFDANFEPEDLVDAVESVPVFSDKKLVVVRDFNLSSPPQRYLSALERIFDTPPGYTILVFLYAQQTYSAPKAGNKPGWFDSVVKLDFTRPDESQLYNWVMRRFKASDKDCDRACAEYLCYVSGGLMAALSPEIEKLAAYRPGEPLRKADIDLVATRIIDVEIYKITDALCMKNAREAMRLTALLLDNHYDAVSILNALSRAARQMYGAKLAIEAQKPARSLMELFSLRFPFIAENLMRNARAFSRRSLARWITLCLEADAAIKSSLQEDGVIVEQLVASLAVAR